MEKGQVKDRTTTQANLDEAGTTPYHRGHLMATGRF